MQTRDLTRRQFLRSTGLGLAALAVPRLTWCAGAAGTRPRRPDIVVILSDDVGFSDIGCYGGEIQTPNLDRLAAGGIRFAQFYNTARCCPTRASLLTGLYPHQAAVGHMMDDKGLDGYRGDLNRRCITIAEALAPAGYGTYAVGKWHVTRRMAADGPKDNWPLQRGFQRYYGTLTGSGNYFSPSTLTRDNALIKADEDPDYRPQQFYYTDAISDHAVRFIAEHQQKRPGDPLFMYVAYTAAHWPMHALDRDIARYRGRYDQGYEPIRRGRFERLRQMGLIDKGWALSSQAGRWDAVADKEWEARRMEVYAAMVDCMDQGIGRIVEALGKAGRLENTLILFLQDNGGCAEEVSRKDKNGKFPMPGPADTFISYGRAWANVSNTPFREYKHWVHEGGIATPLIAHWPAGIARPGRIDHQPGHVIDIMATCVDLAGAAYPGELNGQPVTPMEGVSLMPVLRGRTLRGRAIYWEHEGNRAIRAGKWKLVAKGPAGRWELYDMDLDRTELHDLAAEQPDLVKALAGQWEAWARRTSALPWPWKPPYGQPPGTQPASRRSQGEA